MSLLGSQAPDFTLINNEKNHVTLSGLRGQKVVLAFFPAAFTGVCSKEMCTFRDSMASFNDVGATVFGISVDAPFSTDAFAKANDLNFHLLSDHDRSTVKAYGVALNNFGGMNGYIAAQRAVFVVDESGSVAYEWVAPNPGVEPDYEAVKAAAS
ncbi:MAG: peroxiredoxin [Myxococcota bacterium]|nr:peroxiredoxin [Myxococcota bacterium]